MISVTISDCQRFLGIFNSIKNTQLPLSVSYKLARLVKIIEPELQLYYDKVNERLEEIAEKDENGNYIVEKGNIKVKPEYDKEVEELNNLKIEIPVSFTLEELDSIKVTPEQMLTLISFIEE